MRFVFLFLFSSSFCVCMQTTELESSFSVPEDTRAHAAATEVPAHALICSLAFTSRFQRSTYETNNKAGRHRPHSHYTRHRGYAACHDAQSSPSASRVVRGDQPSQNASPAHRTTPADPRPCVRASHMLDACASPLSRVAGWARQTERIHNKRRLSCRRDFVPCLLHSRCCAPCRCVSARR